MLEFTTRLRGSEFKNALDRLPLSAEVQWEGPYGSFVFPLDVKKLAFVTGGIGITCVRSMLRWLADISRERREGRSGGGLSDARPAIEQIVLLFANRSDEAIPFHQELTALEDQLPELRVVHVISHPGESWQGYTGHIDEKILTRELVSPGEWRFYVSGPPSMVKGMDELLRAWGASPDSINVERYDGYE